VSADVNGLNADLDVVADLQCLPGGRQQVRGDGAAVYETVVAYTDVDERAKVCHVGDAARQTVTHSSVAQGRDAATKQRLTIVYNHHNVITVDDAPRQTTV